MRGNPTLVPRSSLTLRKCSRRESGCTSRLTFSQHSEEKKPRPFFFSPPSSSNHFLENSLDDVRFMLYPQYRLTTRGKKKNPVFVKERATYLLGAWSARCAQLFLRQHLLNLAFVCRKAKTPPADCAKMLAEKYFQGGPRHRRTTQSYVELAVETRVLV